MKIPVSGDTAIYHEAVAGKGIYLIAALLPAALLSVPQAHIDTYQLFKGGDSPLSPINSTLRHALPRHYKSHYFYP